MQTDSFFDEKDEENKKHELDVDKLAEINGKIASVSMSLDSKDS